MKARVGLTTWTMKRRLRVPVEVTGGSTSLVLAILSVVLTAAPGELQAQSAPPAPHIPCSSCLLPRGDDARSPLAPTRSALLSLPLSAISPATDVSRFQETIESADLCHRYLGSPAIFIGISGLFWGGLDMYSLQFRHSVTLKSNRPYPPESVLRLPGCPLPLEPERLPSIAGLSGHSSPSRIVLIGKSDRCSE